MTANLATALAEFQAEMPTVAKAHKAEVPTKSGGKFTYTYAGLADITEAAMPLLTKHGLSFAACPRQTERGYELEGRLFHTSGESIQGALPIAGNTPQEMGSSLTYMRRYLLGCMTGLVTDDDDDGRLAQAAPKPRASRAKPPPVAEVAPITDAQMRKMHATFNDAGITDREARLEFTRDAIGDKAIQSSTELTKTQAGLVIDALERLVTDLYASHQEQP